MKKRTVSLSPSRVLPSTDKAFQEVYEAVGEEGKVFRLKSAAAYAGEVETTQGKFSDVIARELQP